MGQLNRIGGMVDPDLLLGAFVVGLPFFVLWVLVMQKSFTGIWDGWDTALLYSRCSFCKRS